MKSIRRSLIVYVLMLLTVALGAVSWLTYRMTAQSLRERAHDLQNLIADQCKSQSDGARMDLDRRIGERARTMARTARSVTAHDDTQQGVFGATAWVAQGIHPPVPFDVVNELMVEARRNPFQFPPRLVLIEDDLVADEGIDRSHDYYQTYMPSGLPIQRSESLGNQSFVLSAELRKKAVPLTEYFDDVEINGGHRLRRVTLKAPVSRTGGYIPTPPRFFGPFRPKGPSPKNPPKDASKDPIPKAPATSASGGFLVQPVFIQYAIDVEPTEAKILEFERQRDEQFESIAATIDDNLWQLQIRMFWIGLSALGALWLGGYLVICLGLAPLAKMSDAVSQVSPRNFHLPLAPESLPNELQPIAATLVQTLEQLRKAFEREKQAAADISHELRTPLAALMTTLEVALRKARSPDEYREILEECRSSGQHMYALVERLLTLARLDAGADTYRPEPVDVIDIALSCADLIRPLARAKGVDLRLNVPDPIMAQTDPNKLREILTNLLHNAVEYNNPNGSIDLSVERTNGHVRLEVRDTGIGIKPEAIGRLFERFFRADPSRHADTPHAGLGLSIVKSYVDLMGGTIKVESSEAGTTFTVELPFVEPAPVETGVIATPEFAQR